MAIAALLGLSGASSAQPADMTPERGPADLRPPRDGNVAIREELDAARRAGTAAAYDLFIARHPDHPLAATARRERAEILARRGK